MGSSLNHRLTDKLFLALGVLAELEGLSLARLVDYWLKVQPVSNYQLYRGLELSGFRWRGAAWVRYRAGWLATVDLSFLSDDKGRGVWLWPTEEKEDGASLRGSSSGIED